jgi:hypothetical protein
VTGNLLRVTRVLLLLATTSEGRQTAMLTRRVCLAERGDAHADAAVGAAAAHGRGGRAAAPGHHLRQVPEREPGVSIVYAVHFD